MRVVSVNVGLPREVMSAGRLVQTSIFKSPVAGSVAVRRLNLDGDRQSDLSVHGGVYKAVYAYPVEHYAFWREQLPGVELPYGSFGENLTVEGVLEDAAHVGDTFRAGSSELTVTQPRMPCFKLGIRFGRPDMVKRFLASGRSGFYLSVAREGEVAAADAFSSLGHSEPGVSIRTLLRLYLGEEDDEDLLRQATELPALSDGWRSDLRQRLHKLGERRGAT